MTRFVVVLFCWTVLGVHVRTIDGDTAVLDLSIWQGLTARETIRVLGVDTPERKDPGWLDAREFTDTWLRRGGMVNIQTCRRDSFGRILGYVSREGIRLDKVLIEKGLGVER